MEIKTGYIRGTGAAVNVSCGFIPDVVLISNNTDGDDWRLGWVNSGHQVMPFSSGGTNEIQKGDTIVGATSGARAKVTGVVLDSGSWAGGDAAGWLLLDLDSKTGTFSSEAVYATDSANLDDATVTVDVVFTQASTTAVAAVTSTGAITAYVGDDTHGRGFTIGSVISEDAKLLQFVAIRGFGSGANPFIANSL